MIPELPEWAKDAVYTDTDFHFDFKDRLKILAGWTPSFHSGVATEEKPGRTQHFHGRLLILAPKWWPFKPKPIGFVVSSPGDHR